jgi:hypothetical protein
MASAAEEKVSPPSETVFSIKLCELFMELLMNFTLLNIVFGDKSSSQLKSSTMLFVTTGP